MEDKLPEGLPAANIHLFFKKAFTRLQDKVALDLSFENYINVVWKNKKNQRGSEEISFMSVRTDPDFYARASQCAAPSQRLENPKINKQTKSPEDPPGRDVPDASREDRPRERRRLPRARAAAEGQLGTPAGGRGSEPGATVTAAPPLRSATSASAMPLADADGWS